MLLLVSLLKAISEILALSLAGQGMLWLIAGQTRGSYFVYRLFATLTRPVLRLARMITPRFVGDRHVWMVAVLLVFVVWVFAGAHKLRLCATEAPDNPLCAPQMQTLEQRRGTQ